MFRKIFAVLTVLMVSTVLAAWPATAQMPTLQQADPQGFVNIIPTTISMDDPNWAAAVTYWDDAEEFRKESNPDSRDAVIYFFQDSASGIVITQYQLPHWCGAADCLVKVFNSEGNDVLSFLQLAGMEQVGLRPAATKGYPDVRNGEMVYRYDNRQGGGYVAE